MISLSNKVFVGQVTQSFSFAYPVSNFFFLFWI